MTEPLHEAVRAVIEYDRIHPASGGLRTRLDHLFNVWNAEAADAARKASRGSGLDVARAALQAIIDLPTVVPDHPHGGVHPPYLEWTRVAAIARAALDPTP